MDFSVWTKRGSAMTSPHTHPDVELNFLITGRLRYLMNHRYVTIRPGELAIFWAGVPHQTVEKQTAFQGIWLTFPLLWMLRGTYTRGMALALLRGETLLIPARHVDRIVFDRWEKDFASRDEKRIHIATSEIGNYLARLSLILEGSQKGFPLPGEGRHLDTVLNFLVSHYQEDLSVEDIAKVARLHPKYLLNLFRKTFRMTLWEYVIRLRVAHAQRLLVTTDLKIIDVAMESGFNSLSAFYLAFRKIAPDLTPSSFRAESSVCLERIPSSK